MALYTPKDDERSCLLVCIYWEMGNRLYTPQDDGRSCLLVCIYWEMGYTLLWMMNVLVCLYVFIGRWEMGAIHGSSNK